jgi:acyl-CoA synthetase (AMP-forming)/AMP-acid ligase II
MTGAPLSTPTSKLTSWAKPSDADRASGDPRLANLGYWCLDGVMRTPNKVALIDLSGSAERTITYAALDRRLDGVAGMLSARGMRPGDRLALSMTNRIEYIEAMFGAMRAGVVPVPLNTKLGVEALDHVIRDAGCTGAIVEETATPHPRPIVEALGAGIRIMLGEPAAGWESYEAALATASASFAPLALAADHMCFLPYTSGSTGKPKGVVLTHAGQCWWLRCVFRHWPSSPDARTLVAVPLYHKNAMAGAIKPTLAAGGSTVILPNFEPRRFLHTLSAYRCTKAGAVPAVYTLLLQERDLIDTLDFSALQVMTVGSAPTPKELQDAIENVFKVPVIETYGLTEGGPMMVGSPLDGRRIPHGSCGVAWPEGEIRLVRADGADDAHDGEMWVRNPGVTPGYHNLPQVNTQRLVDGWLRTGDLFHRDANGFFYFRGRTDDMFNCGGENIYPIEVENLLMRHPAVAEVSVVPLPHAVKGEAPVAMIVLKRGHAATEDDIRSFCLANGPAYAHPRRILFVEAMPLNGPGKIDRRVVQTLLTEHYGTLS